MTVTAGTLAARSSPAPVDNAGIDDAGERAGIQVIARAASILRALERQPAGLSLGELAIRVQLARSTVQRIVRALIDERMLMPAGKAGGVTLGPMLVRLAAGVTIDAVQLAHPILEALSQQLDETVDLSSFDGDQVLFVDQVVGAQRLAAVSRVGERFALHVAANGKALLSARSRDDPAWFESYLRRMQKSGARISIKALNAEMDDIRTSGIAFDRDEHTPGVSAVGTWFQDAAGVYYALSVPVPSIRFDDGRKLTAPLLATRRQLIDALGGGA